MQTQNIALGFILTALAGAATPIGGLLAVGIAKTNIFKVWSFGLGISAGVMVYLSVFDLLPEAAALAQTTGRWLSVPGFFVLGLIITWLIDLLTHRWVERCDPVDTEQSDSGKPLCSAQSGRVALGGTALMRTGLVAALAIAIHNFPEGIATFVTATADLSLGLPVAIAIAIHNLPEGFCVALPIYCSTKSAKRAVAYALAAGLAEPLGAVGAFLFLGPFITPQLLGCLFATVAGIMVYVAVDEIIPAGRRLGRSHLCLSGFAVGMFIMAIAMSIIK